MKKILFSLLLCTIMVCVLGCAYGTVLARRATNVSPGMTKAEVSRIMKSTPYSSSFIVLNGVQRERVLYCEPRGDGRFSVIEFTFERGRVVGMDQRIESDLVKDKPNGGKRPDRNRNERDGDRRNQNQRPPR